MSRVPLKCFLSSNDDVEFRFRGGKQLLKRLGSGKAKDVHEDFEMTIKRRGHFQGENFRTPIGDQCKLM